MSRMQVWVELSYSKLLLTVTCQIIQYIFHPTCEAPSLHAYLKLSLLSVNVACIHTLISTKQMQIC